MKSLRFFLVFFCFFSNYDIVVAEDKNPQQNDLNMRIEVLERTISGVQKSLLNAISSGKFLDEHKDIIQNFSELNDEIKLLRSDVERLEIKMKKYSSKFDAIESSINNRINQSIKNSQKDNTIDNKEKYIISNISKEIETESLIEDSKQSNEDDSKNAAAEYQKAYVMLKQKNIDGNYQYDKAVEAFYGFIKAFPDSPLVGNAYYWLGNIYMQQKFYSKAAIEFLNGYKINSKSGRAVDNLLGLSDALFKIGKNKETCSTLNKLYNSFPNLSTMNKRDADELYKNASCTNE